MIRLIDLQRMSHLHSQTFLSILPAFWYPRSMLMRLQLTRSSDTTPLDSIKDTKTQHSRLPTAGQYLFSDIVGDPKRLMSKNLKVVQSGTIEAHRIAEEKRGMTGESPKKHEKLVNDEGGIIKQTPKSKDLLTTELAKPGETVKQPPKKLNFIAVCKAYFKDRYDIIFFTALNRFFGPNYKEETKKLNPIKEGDRMRVQIKLFQDIKTEHEKLPKYQGGKKYPLLLNLVTQVKSDLIWAIIFRVAKQVITVFIPLIMKSFLNNAKLGIKLEFSYGIWLCLLVGFLTLTKELFGQQAFRYTSFAREEDYNGPCVSACT